MSDPGSVAAAAAAAVAAKRQSRERFGVLEIDTSSTSSANTELRPLTALTPQICVENKAANSMEDVTVNEDSELYINQNPIMSESQQLHASSQDTNSQAQNPQAAAEASAATNPQATPGTPTIRIEINKRFYTINNATISINTDGDVADLKFSLDIGPVMDFKRTGSEVKKVVNSIGRSFNSSKKVLVGAANKLLKQGRAAITAGSSKSACALPLPVEIGDNDQVMVESGTADSVQQQQHEAPDVSAGLAAGNESASLSNSGAPENRSTGARSSCARHTASSSQENTIESETAATSPTTGDGPPLPSKPNKSKTLIGFLQNLTTTKSTQPSQEASQSVKTVQPEPSEVTAVAFPDCVPDKLKLLFQINPETHLIATVYAADTVASADEIKQDKKRLIDDPVKRKIKVDGKSRPVWLNPTAGEKIEIWKLYYDKDDRCHMMLGRVPGTKLYGYILHREIDIGKKFNSPSEQAAYDKAVSSLACSDDIYEAAENEDGGEVYA